MSFLADAQEYLGVKDKSAIVTEAVTALVRREVAVQLIRAHLIKHGKQHQMMLPLMLGKDDADAHDHNDRRSAS